MAACSIIAQLLGSYPDPSYRTASQQRSGCNRLYMRVQDGGASSGSNQPFGEALETKIVVCKCPSQVRTAVSTVCCDTDRPLLASFRGTPYVYPVLLEDERSFRFKVPICCIFHKYQPSPTAMCLHIVSPPRYPINHHLL
jgi:hypothetical protein